MGQRSPIFSNYTPEKNELSSAEYARLSAKAPAYEFYNIVETQSIVKMLADGKAIDLAIPQRNNKSQYLLVEELNLDKSNLFLRGSIVGDSSSLVTIRSEKDMLYGTIRKGNQSFTITGIKPGVSVISQNKLRINTPYCPLDGSFFDSASDSTFVSPYDFSKSGTQKMALCPESRLNILVMFTTAAEQSVPDIEQTARNSVDQMNGFLHNSGLDLRANLVGTVAFPEFVEGNRITDDLGRLGGNVAALQGVQGADPALVDIVQEQITLTGADYVVFLTGRREDGVIGFADATVNGPDDFELGPPNRLAIVTAEAATEEFTFGHEVGHLMGCHHQAEEIIECPNHGESIHGAFFVLYDLTQFNYLVVPDPSGPEFAHSFVDDRCRTFLGKNKADVSVMFSNAALDGPPILREQKWNVDYLPAYSNQNDDDEGDEQSNNARRIQETTAEVLALGDCTPGVNVTVNQFPPIVEPGQTYSFGGFATDCDGTPLYTWEISTDGVNFTSIATGSSANLTMPAGLQPFATVFIRLSVRCDDGDGQPLNDLTADALVSILVLTDDDCNGFDCFGNSNEPGGQAKALAVRAPQIAASPNPATNQVVIDFGVNIERFEVLSGNGDQIMLNRHTGKKGHQVTINVAAYRPGLYLIRGYAPDGVVTTKFIKQ
ncbi:T9SS type A sorting domain-containing protein [Neolewinella agarilytica]|uniref:T9SS type A sorting domain-containing protein n=1 Tax=Neolewinella agarilytica TaxID=478744 RepID=UPI002357D727|nr:T9SS type A sorting domain-containing protein [Neolewinella agarilytica]